MTGVSAAALASLAEIVADGLRVMARHNRRKRGGIGLLHCLNVAEVLQQTPRSAGAGAGNLEQFGRAIANRAVLAVKGHSEAVGLIANQLDQVQDRRVMIEGNRIALLAVDVENFFALGNGGERLVD